MAFHSLMGEAIGSRVAGLSYEITRAGRKIKIVRKDIAAPRAKDIQDVADSVSRINRQPDLKSATETTALAVNAFVDDLGPADEQTFKDFFVAQVQNTDETREYATANPGDMDGLVRRFERNFKLDMEH